MARAAVALRGLGRRQSRTAPLVGVSVALLSTFAVSFDLWTAAFAASLASRPSLRRGARGIRVACVARGGEAMVAEEYEVGDEVKAFSEEDSQWYPGRITSVADEGTYTVLWDDSDGGPETVDVGADGLQKHVIFKDYVVGDDCEAEFPDDNTWYPGTVSAINDDGTFTVTWDDPDGGPETANVEPEKMKKVTVFKGYREGDEILAVFPDDGQWYSATVQAVKADGTFVVKWDDPDGGPEESELTPKNMKLPPIPLDKLEVGARYEGTVMNVEDYGAFVDIGAEKEGLVHICRVSGQHLESIYDHVEQGQDVEVWVTGVTKDGKLSLTMVEGLIAKPPRRSSDYEAFEGISRSEWLEGTVFRVAPYGAFVLVRSPEGAEAPGLVSAIKYSRYSHESGMACVPRQGDEVKVRVIKLDLVKRRLYLSMREKERADLSSFEKVSPDEWVKGKVAWIKDFGAFVTVALEDGSSADGLLHRTQIKDGSVEKVEDELEVGQDVKVRILSVDLAAGQMSLSMKGE